MGFNVLPTSNRYGRMLEIKNRYSDTVPITGNPKKDYWIQMQLQMAVCDLNECDFLETRFIEYNNYQEFLEDGSFSRTKDKKLKGIFIAYLVNGKITYFYPDLNISQEDFLLWEKKIQAENIDNVWISNNYWKLEKFSCVLVMRNKLWFDNIIPKISSVWDTIARERQDKSYTLRAPKKHQTSNIVLNNCLIDINSLVLK